MKRIFRIITILALATACPAVISCEGDKPVENPGPDPTPEPGPDPTPEPGPDPGTDPTPVPDFSKEEDAIGTYFSETLKAYAGPYSSTCPLSTEELEDAEKFVWEVWKKQNDAFDEEKLVTLTTLNKEKSLGKFYIPVELEEDLNMPGSPAKMNYYWGSHGSRPEGGYPAFIYLHGSGAVTTEWANGFDICMYSASAGPAAYLIPRIPNGVTTSEFSLYRWWQKGKQCVWEKFIRQSFLRDEINPNRFFFFGVSEGAYGSQRLASFYADYLAGAGPIAGGEFLQNAPPENCANIAFSLRTGSEDNGYGRNIITTNTKREFGRLAGLHKGYYEHNIEVVPDATHTSVGYYETIPWLIDKVRNPYPKYVYWERLDQDGIYRKGFHNLYIPETANPTERLCYEMTIDGNNISLNVKKVTYTTTAWAPEPYYNAVDCSKSYSPATGGKVVIYLCDELVDLGSEVTVTVNGTEAYRGIPELNLGNLVSSCALFYDPYRLYPAAVEVSF